MMFNRGRRRWLVILVPLLAVGVGTAPLLFSTAQERKEIFGKADPVTGYRCRFTLPSDWKREVVPADTFEMFAISRSPVQRWIRTHLLHRQFNEFPQITIISGRFPSTGVYVTQDGYPAMLTPQAFRMDTCRHLLIDGHPATVYTYSASNDRLTYIVFCTPEHSFFCTLEMTSEVQDDAQVDQEMRAIIASFHIERVAAGVGGKR